MNHLPNGNDNGDSRNPLHETGRQQASYPATRDASYSDGVLSHNYRETSQQSTSPPRRKRSLNSSSNKGTIRVIIPRAQKPWEYQPDQGDTTVDSVLAEVKRHGQNGAVLYKIEYGSGKREIVSSAMLLKLRNGSDALKLFSTRDEANTTSRSSTEPGVATRGKRLRTQTKNEGFVDMANADLSDEDEIDTGTKKRRLASGRPVLRADSSRQGSRRSSRNSARLRKGEEESDLHSTMSKRDSRPTRQSRQASRSAFKPTIKLKRMLSSSFLDEEDEDELAGDHEVEDSEGSDIVFASRPTGRHGKLSQANSFATQTQIKHSARPSKVFSDDSSSSPVIGTRRSGRNTKATKNMKEVDMNEEFYADAVATKNAPKVISIREVYQSLPTHSRFRIMHRQDCDVCGGRGKLSNKGASELIYCQGCSSSIHKVCLGYRAGREHIITKIGHENFVLQCRRCIGLAKKKDPQAPRLDVCQGCKKPGASCTAFSSKKPAKQEEKLREENGGQDPITSVSSNLVNNEDNVLFRCVECQRAWHYEHLPPLQKQSETLEDLEELRDHRFNAYSSAWTCKDCLNAPAKVQTLVAWRPLDRKSYNPEQTLEEFSEDQKEYLVKWDGKSYFACAWMPGAWVWGVTPAVMRKSFFRRGEGDNLMPKFTHEEAIPEDFLRMEIIFEVEYAKGFRSVSEAYDKEHITDVKGMLVKFQGLSYDEAVWEKPPPPAESDRWDSFVAAYNEYLAGRYFESEPVSTIKERVERFRKLSFEKRVELKEQPSALLGGQIMPYQMEGLNWLLWNFHQKKNVILADEMGLGKTIQIISFFAALVKDKPRCWPFLVVTPNSTCPNWRREIKKWAPELRVVAYYGGKKARDMSMQYELFPDQATDMRAHIVVTSYEGPVDESSRLFFKRIKWAGMVVDEGQRLKNDENLLYGALKALKTPFQVLLTGTPLQNNKRELFNLLQFLDSSINAAKLDERYEELTKDNLPELHDLIRPFFLRRTKLQVLKFLPPMAQVILPISMSVVQKKLYKSILAKNPELIKAIFGQGKKVLRPAERGNLNNILMQLRKCLCHPFLYSSAIEERSVNEKALHRNLVDASSKFQLLEIMLPKLQKRGHRVLIFSQFLNQLDLVEDFLSGLSLPFERLDGSIGALEKQKRIDAFNAPDSPLFAFLLSTRAGGVGINLATADTVIIMDPDFNPHQDIQALSRAHRIGQKNKVLVFQLMTKDSAEEKIVQIGRKKMALDHALIETMDAEDDAGVDLESILKHGAEALFNDDDQHDIHYDSKSVDELLDRTQVENTNADNEKTAESQFSYARVWANDKGVLTDDIGDADEEPAARNPSVWDKILEQREVDAQLEKLKNMQTFGRGKRARQAVGYSESRIPGVDDDAVPSFPVKRSKDHNSASDVEFNAASDSEETDVDGEGISPSDLTQGKSKGSASSPPTPQKAKAQVGRNVSPTTASSSAKKAVSTGKSVPGAAARKTSIIDTGKVSKAIKPHLSAKAASTFKKPQPNSKSAGSKDPKSTLKPASAVSKIPKKAPQKSSVNAPKNQTKAKATKKAIAESSPTNHSGTPGDATKIRNDIVPKFEQSSKTNTQQNVTLLNDSLQNKPSAPLIQSLAMVPTKAPTALVAKAASKSSQAPNSKNTTHKKQTLQTKNGLTKRSSTGLKTKQRLIPVINTPHFGSDLHSKTPKDQINKTQKSVKDNPSSEDTSVPNQMSSPKALNNVKGDRSHMQLTDNITQTKLSRQPEQRSPRATVKIWDASFKNDDNPVAQTAEHETPVPKITPPPKRQALFSENEAQGDSHTPPSVKKPKVEHNVCTRVIEMLSHENPPNHDTATPAKPCMFQDPVPST